MVVVAVVIVVVVGNDAFLETIFFQKQLRRREAARPLPGRSGPPPHGVPVLREHGRDDALLLFRMT